MFGAAVAGCFVVVLSIGRAGSGLRARVLDGACVVLEVALVGG
jgi:hypothetical protein